ncbi:ABC transporter transmembrane domain-containing protein [Actinokineospora fastidiosa]|uniref:ABC transporter n=1 Tax=Actinokineospora fastidiosa TaxID=1816 RepID=A0A918LHI2_9PSEU|nr:ABC transporter ATP-binding protein [Actinokineospora fastidiosa]GGS50142.1 ABC transporter [Actinokineospora fastidiosa]
MGERRVPYADPGRPDIRGPGRFLWWLAIAQWRQSAQGTLWGTLWMCGLILPPYLVQRAIDDGLRAGDRSALLGWTAAIAAAGLFDAAVAWMRHRTMTLVRGDAMYRTVQVVVRHVVRLGAEFPRRLSAGELASVQATDMQRISWVMTSTGPGVGAVVAYALTAVVLFDVSWLLAVVVLLGVPVMAVTLGPLLRGLRGRESGYRERQGALTARTADIVAGLRVLCGIGGKDVFARRYHADSAALCADGYRVGAITSWVQAVGACLPVVFLAAVTWIAARLTAAGTITVGEMVAVYGYVAVLVVPVSFLIEGADDISRGLVSAERVVAVLSVPVPERENTAPAPVCAPLTDPSGVRVEPGMLTALVSTDPTPVVERLGGYAPGACWGNVPVPDVADLRARVVVSDDSAYLFPGPLRAVLGGDEPTAAIRAAAAEDIVEALPEGLDTVVETQARNLSGGQRQRLRLARALLADPDVLILVEPASAVDAHTEAAIADGVADYRKGRTTVLVTTSPLLLQKADRVCFAHDGRVVEGTHAELLADADYRALVEREA